MKKGFLVVFLIGALVTAIGLTACGSGTQTSSEASSQASSEAASEATSEASAETSSEASAEATPEESSEESAVDGAAYGYAGSDPVELAIYKYMVEEVGKYFDKADVSIPSVSIVNVDNSNADEIVVYGDFWIYNYNIEGNTLECVSGGNFPGVMHLSKDGDGYVVSSFDKVSDGADFDSSAKELFGEHYNAFMEIYSNDSARDVLRKASVSDYVKLNGLDVTQYQDYGWDPVQLDK